MLIKTRHRLSDETMLIKYVVIFLFGSHVQTGFRALQVFYVYIPPEVK
jgi:hypothetical protein